MKLIRSAKVVILDKNGAALTLRRSGSHPREAFRPDLPGGVTKEYETFEVGLTREIFEETGITIKPKQLVLVYTTTHRIFGMSITRLLYAVRLQEVAPHIAISWEHDEFSWQPIADVKDMEKPYQKGIDYANEHDLWKEI